MNPRASRSDVQMKADPLDFSLDLPDLCAVDTVYLDAVVLESQAWLQESTHLIPPIPCHGHVPISKLSAKAQW